MPGPTVDDLREAIARVHEFMERHALPPGPTEQVRLALREVAAGDAHGAQRYLATMGGKGPLDTYIEPLPGVVDSHEEQQRLHADWQRLLDHTNELARVLLRAS